MARAGLIMGYIAITMTFLAVVPTLILPGATWVVSGVGQWWGWLGGHLK
jgi:hypothetical protein